MPPESGGAAREHVSITAACERLNVTRRTIYTYICAGSVEYFRAADGALRIYVDSLDGSSRRKSDMRARRRRVRAEAPAVATSREPASASAAAVAPASDDRLKGASLFEWHGRPQKVRNMGRPAGETCPCCGVRLVEENLYDSLEPEYESEETLCCVLCGWSAFYQCRPLTRGPGSQYYVVKSLRSFDVSRRANEFARALTRTSPRLPLDQRTDTARTRVFRSNAHHSLRSSDGTEMLLLIGARRGFVALHCRQHDEAGGIDVHAVTLLRWVRIEWEGGRMQLYLRSCAVTADAVASEPSWRQFDAALAPGQDVLAFIDVCADEPRLDRLTTDDRERVAALRRRQARRYQWGSTAALLYGYEEAGEKTSLV